MENNTPQKESMSFLHTKIVPFGLILGLSLLGSTLVITGAFLTTKKSDNVISVSGSAKEKVTADSARWTARFTRTVKASGVKAGYEQMKQDEKTVKDFITLKGFDQVDISPVSMNENYKPDYVSEKEYILSQEIEVKSKDPQKIKELAKASEQLASQGILFQPNPAEYYYSKLPELRVSLLPNAIKDARARANMIAQSSDLTIASVKSVSMGVVQVLSEGSVDVSDYGSYDTSKIDKEVMITVKVTFGLQ